MAVTTDLTTTAAAGWKARWCWTGKHLSRPWNTYALFRRLVELPAKPQRFTVRVSADARYVLYVNGRRIHQGPARSFPQFQAYDTLELADAMQPGVNSICAVVHQFGVPTFQSAYRDASGFLLDGMAEVDGQQFPVYTPDGWVCRPARGWRKDVCRLSIQLGFQEHYDASADPADWLSSQYAAPAEDGWEMPVDLGPVGMHPWLSMEARGVPLLADHIERFAAISAQFIGENARGYKVADDVYHLLAQESPKREKSLLENPDALLRDDGEVTTITPRADGNFLMTVLDLGQIRAGHLILDIAQAAGDEIIDIVYTEEIDKNGQPMLLGVPKPTISEEAPADRYRCRPGAQRWEPFAFKGLRYATLIFRNLAQPLKVRFVGLRQVHAGVEDLGAFECSDQRLNQIWKIGRETLRNCMFDAYVDCPSREQAQWWGDARVQFKTNVYAFGDDSLLVRGIRQAAQSQAADGSLHSAPPADMPWLRLPDYMMTWVGTLWDHYFHTGHTELLRASLPVMHRLFDFLATHEIRDGLIGAFDGFWVLLDRAELYKSNFSGVLNLMYLASLRWAAAICHVLGEPRAAVYSRKADLLAAMAERYFWDAKAKVWRDGFDAEKNAMVDNVSQHMNALAILLRLKPETHTILAREILLKPATSRRGKVITASPFFYAYVLDALAEANLHAEVVDLIAEKWGAMIDAGATTFWELWQVTGESRCHAWSASPVYHLSQQVLGVAPVDVGWKQVRIAPVPGKLEYARGRVPSPLGIIKVEWEKAGEDQLAVRVDLPPGMTGEFVGPLGETRTLATGGTEFHT